MSCYILYFICLFPADIVGNVMNLDLESSSASILSSGYYGASFPVDVVVYIRVQPSCIRASCLPASKVGPLAPRMLQSAAYRSQISTV